MNSFRGFYFKQATANDALSLIAATGQGAGGRRFASIQVVLPEAAFTVPFPVEEARLEPAGPSVRFGENRLDASGMKVDLRGGGHEVCGELIFGPLSRPRGDIMGPFGLLPGLECRHRLVSMAHEVRGMLSVDGRERRFDGALGYIEGDSGRSFPKNYLWTQVFSPGGEPRSVMLSVAEIPCAGLRFTGILGFALLDDREIRLATYLRARVVEIADGCVTVRQGGYTLTVEFDLGPSTALEAPVNGVMTREIGERLSGRARYRMTLDGRVLFDFLSENASFEYEYAR